MKRAAFREGQSEGQDKEVTLVNERSAEARRDATYTKKNPRTD